MSSTTVPNPANGSFPGRSSRLSAGCQGDIGEVIVSSKISKGQLHKVLEIIPFQAQLFVRHSWSSEFNQCNDILDKKRRYDVGSRSKCIVQCIVHHQEFNNIAHDGLWQLYGVRAGWDRLL